MKTAADELAIDRNVLIEWLARGSVVIADANNFAVFVAQIQNGLLFRHGDPSTTPVDDANPTC